MALIGFTVGAVIDAIGSLIAGKTTFFTFCFGMEPVAVGIKLGFGEIFIKGNMVLDS